MIGRPRIHLLAVLLLTLPLVSLEVRAQAWPSRPIKIVIPVAAAGAMDPLARAVAARLSEMWKQSVLVENRVGANGIIGADYVSKAEPDGYTLLMSEASPFVMSPHLYRTLPFDGLAGFTPITQVSRVPWVIGISAAVPANTLQEFVALARAQPGKLAYGSFGLGSSVHVRVEQLKQALGIDLNHVPYKGAGPAMNDLLGGQIAMVMISPGLVEPHVRTGKLRMIAATTPERLAALPALPTVAELAVPGFEAGTWFGMFGPPRLPQDIVIRVHAAMKVVLGSPSFQQQFISGNWMVPSDLDTPEQFARFMRTDFERWGQAIRASGVSVD